MPDARGRLAASEEGVTHGRGWDGMREQVHYGFTVERREVCAMLGDASIPDCWA